MMCDPSDDDLVERAADIAAVIECLLVEAAARRASAEMIERQARELQLALAEMQAELARRSGWLQ